MAVTCDRRTVRSTVSCDRKGASGPAGRSRRPRVQPCRIARAGDYSSVLAFLAGFPVLAFSAFFIAAPRMSPRDAPLSDEPNSAIACLSSSVSRALIDSDTRRWARSTVMILASTFSPTAKTVGALLRTLTRQVGALDEAGDLAVDQHFDAAIGDRRNRGGDDRALAQAAELVLQRIAARYLLDAKSDAFLLDVDLQNLCLDQIALLEGLERFLAFHLPRDVGQVHHAVDVTGQAHEQAEFGDVLDLAFDQSSRPDNPSSAAPTGLPGTA